MEDQGDGVFLAEVSEPENGWTAFFVELTYDVGAPTPLKVTTNIGIVPEIMPFAEKDPTLPTSLTLRCEVPSRDVVLRIREALESPKMKALAEDPLLSSNGTTSKGGVSVTLNWIPKGGFEEGASAIAGFLKNLGCSNFVFQLESGRLAPSSK